MLLGQGFPRLFPVGRFLLFARKSSLETFELRLRFAVMPWVLNSGSLGISQEAFEPDIYTQLFAGWDMLDFALGLDAELRIIAIGPADNANSFDVFDWKCLNLLFLIANQAKTANTTAISE